MRKKIFLVISEEDIICPECGSPLCRRDRRLRVHKEAGGKKSWFAINRLKGTNEKCRRLHNELPDCMIPYKHYGSDDLGTEDYSCEGTMKHWKWYEFVTTSESRIVTAHGIFNKIIKKYVFHIYNITLRNQQGEAQISLLNFFKNSNNMLYFKK